VSAVDNYRKSVRIHTDFADEVAVSARLADAAIAELEAEIDRLNEQVERFSAAHSTIDNATDEAIDELRAQAEVATATGVGEAWVPWTGEDAAEVPPRCQR
jgi:phage host-nuclease inhibitor protein Gam